MFITRHFSLSDHRRENCKGPPTIMMLVNVGSTRDLIGQKKTVTQSARLTLREKVDFARQQPDRNRQNKAATVDSCFVLIGTRQDGVAVLYVKPATEPAQIKCNKTHAPPCHDNGGTHSDRSLHVARSE